MGNNWADWGCIKHSVLMPLAGHLVSLKKMSPDWDLILAHNDVTPLDIAPGSVVFWLQNASKFSH